MTDNGTDHFDRWREAEETAEAMIPLLGRLYREQDVILYIFGTKLLRTSISIMTAHGASEPYIGRELSVHETMPVVEALAEMNLDSAKIDLGKLTAGFQESGSDDLAGYLAAELGTVTTGHGRLLEEPTDVVLYGFGRIGRLLARILIERAGSAPSSACGRSCSGRRRTTTSRSERACCDSTRSTARSPAPSSPTRRTTNSSSTATR